MLFRSAVKAKAAEVDAPKKKGGSVLALPGLQSVGAAYTLVKMSRYCLMFWLPYFLAKQCAHLPPAPPALTPSVPPKGSAGAPGRPSRRRLL